MARHDLRDDQDFSPGALVAAGVGGAAEVAMETMTPEQRHKADVTLEAAIQELIKGQEWLRGRAGR